MTIEQPAPVFATTKPSTGGPMSKLANHDSLTGLLCRSAFEIDKNSPAFLNQVSAVFLIDFDRFSHINRDHGRAIGDFVLAMAADRLASLSYDVEHVCYRYEGDRFIQLLLSDEPLNPSLLESIAKEIQSQLQRGIRLSDRDIELSCTVTVAERKDDVPLNTLLTEALLYSAELKYQGPGQVHILSSGGEAESQVS